MSIRFKSSHLSLAQIISLHFISLHVTSRHAVACHGITNHIRMLEFGWVCTYPTENYLCEHPTPIEQYIRRRRNDAATSHPVDICVVEHRPFRLYTVLIPPPRYRGVVTKSHPPVVVRDGEQIVHRRNIGNVEAVVIVGTRPTSVAVGTVLRRRRAVAPHIEPFRWTVDEGLQLVPPQRVPVLEPFEVYDEDVRKAPYLHRLARPHVLSAPGAVPLVVLVEVLGGDEVLEAIVEGHRRVLGGRGSRVAGGGGGDVGRVVGGLDEDRGIGVVGMVRRCSGPPFDTEEEEGFGAVGTKYGNELLIGVGKK